MMKLLDLLSRFPLPTILIVGPIMAVAGLIPLARHVLWCIGHSESMQHILLLGAGVIIPPLGWVHGMSLLLGFGGWL